MTRSHTRFPIRTATATPAPTQLASLGLAAGLAWLAFASIACNGAEDKPPAKAAPREGEVTLHGKTWTVELAISDQQRRQGLAGRDHLPADRGMLFVFENSAVRRFWMQGCQIPLDIAFLDRDGTVVKTYTMTVEPDGLGRKRYSSVIPAKYALEVAAGQLAKAGVREGDTARISADIPDAP
jgi:hypothetical protein